MGEAAEDLKDDLEGEVVDETLTDEIDEVVDDESEDKVVELWQEVESTDDGEIDAVPVGTHIKMKSKLKGRISERDDEISKLRTELEEIKQTRVAPKESTSIPQRPLEEDFDTTEEYRAALTKYEDDRSQARFEAREAKKLQSDSIVQTKKVIDSAVDGHYERAAGLIEKSGISSDVFKRADETVRLAMESLRPKEGDLIVDQMINTLGEGSEKVLFFLGRNNKALNAVKGMIAEDPSGMKALVYLGQQKERLTNPKKRISNAPPPAGDANGDVVQKDEGVKLKRKYDAAHKKQQGDVAYRYKQKARKAGVDTSSW